MLMLNKIQMHYLFSNNCQAFRSRNKKVLIFSKSDGMCSVFAFGRSNDIRRWWAQKRELGLERLI